MSVARVLAFLRPARRWLVLVGVLLVAHALLDRLGETRGPFAASGRPDLPMAALTAIVCILRWIVLVGGPARLAWAGVDLAARRLSSRPES